MKQITFSLALIGMVLVLSVPPLKLPAQTGSASTETDLILSRLQSNTMAVFKVDTSRLLIADVPEGSSTAATKFLQQNLDSLKSNVDGKPIYGWVDLPYSFGQPHLRMLVAKGPKSEQFLSKLVEEVGISYVKEQDEYLLMSVGQQWIRQVPFTMFSKARWQKENTELLTPGNLPIPKERWSAALDLIKDYPIQVAIVPPDYLWKTYEETMTELPEELGRGAVSQLTQGLKFMAIGIDPKAMTLTATVQSDSPEAAQQFAQLLPTMLEKITLTLPQPYQKTCQKILAEYAPSIQQKIEGDRIVYSLRPSDTEEASTKFATIAEQVLTTFLAKEAKPRLRELAIAIHNYESAFGCFPAAKNQRNADGSSGLSWRVHILPFLDGHGELYKQFKLDEPWDSPNNLPLLNKMPDVFQTGSFKLAGKPDPIPEGHTMLVAPVGEGTIVGGKDIMTFSRITDGTSNTIMFVKVKPEHAVPWTAPQDYKFDPAKPATGLDVDAAGNFMSAFADGSVHEIPADLPAKTMLHLFQMNDGQVVDWPR